MTIVVKAWNTLTCTLYDQKCVDIWLSHPYMRFFPTLLSQPQHTCCSELNRTKQLWDELGSQMYPRPPQQHQCLTSPKLRWDAKQAHMVIMVRCPQTFGSIAYVWTEKSRVTGRLVSRRQKQWRWLQLSLILHYIKENLFMLAKNWALERRWM